MNFKNWTLLAVSPLVVALAFAQEPPRQEPQAPPRQEREAAPAAAPEPETTGTKEVPAEVVAADAASKTIRVKVLVKKDAASEPALQEGTLPVDPEAVPVLATVGPADKVKLLCRMSGDKVIAVKAINRVGAGASDHAVKH